MNGYWRLFGEKRTGVGGKNVLFAVSKLGEIPLNDSLPVSHIVEMLVQNNFIRSRPVAPVAIVGQFFPFNNIGLRVANQKLVFDWDAWSLSNKD